MLWSIAASPALVGTETDEHRAVVRDVPVGHVASEDLAEAILVGARDVGVRCLLLDLDAVGLRPPHYLLLPGDRQRLPRGHVVGPFLQEEDRPSGTRAAVGDQRDVRSIDQGGVLGAVDEAGQVAIVPVGPARRLFGHRGQPVEVGDPSRAASKITS